MARAAAAAQADPAQRSFELRSTSRRARRRLHPCSTSKSRYSRRQFAAPRKVAAERRWPVLVAERSCAVPHPSTMYCASGPESRVSARMGVVLPGDSERHVAFGRVARLEEQRRRCRSSLRMALISARRVPRRRCHLWTLRYPAVPCGPSRSYPLMLLTALFLDFRRSAPRSSSAAWCRRLFLPSWEAANAVAPPDDEKDSDGRHHVCVREPLAYVLHVGSPSKELGTRSPDWTATGLSEF